MTSPTKLMLYSLLVSSSLALPTPKNEVEVLTARRACPSRMIADFDELKTISPGDFNLPADGNLQIIPDGYKELDWNKGFRYTNSAGAVSESNLAFSDTTTALTGPPRISLYNNLQSFDLRSALLECRLNSQGALPLPTNCIITITGTKTNGDIVSQDFINNAEGFKKYILRSPGFTNLKSVEFSRKNTVAFLTPLTLVAYENIEFDIFRPC